MIVERRMTPDPITATPKTTHREAVELMREHGFRRLPVVDKRGKLVGIVSEVDLLSTAPSPATTLSIYEIYTLLDKLTLDQIMVSPVLAVEEDCDIAAAARFMVDNKVSCLPVMQGDKLVGIITETDIYRAFVEVLGGGQPGQRCDLRVVDRPGELAEIAQAVADAGGNIVSLTVFRGEDAEHGEISIKELGADEAKLKAALEALEGVEVVRLRLAGQDKLLKLGNKK
jgi:acetoin utilization protein AcuB